MKPGDIVCMDHPEGFATINGAGGSFVGWIPNGIAGVVYLLTPDGNSAVVKFGGKLVVTAEVGNLRLEQSRTSASVA